MKFQILFSAKNKKNIINLSSAEFAQRVVKFKFSFEILLDAHGRFSAIFYKGDDFCDLRFAFMNIQAPSEKAPINLKGKNLKTLKQILSF